MRNVFTRGGRRKSQRRGMLTMEWILLITVLVIGVIGGLGAVRNALVSELDDLAGAIEALHTAGEPYDDI